MIKRFTMGSTVLNTGRLSLLNYTDQFFAAVLMVLLARFCDIVLLGQYLTLTAFWAWGAMFVDFGLNPVLIRGSAQHGYNTDLLVDVVLIKIIVLIIVFCLFCVWNSFVQRVSGIVAVFLPGVIGIRGLNSTLSALLAGQNRAIVAAKCQVVTRMLLVVFLWFALVLKHDMGYAVVVHFVLELLLSCLLWQGTAFFKPVFSRTVNIQSLKRIFKESAVVGLTGSSVLLMLKQPLFWLERYAPCQAALYGLTVRLMEMFLVPVYALLITLFPEAVRNQKNLNFKISQNQGGLIAFLLVFLILLSFLLPELHLFRFIALELSPLDRSMPCWVFCTILLTVVQILAVYLFLKEKLHLALFASLGINGMICLYFFLLNLTEWNGLFRYESSLVLVALSLVLMIAGVLWRMMKGEE